jgi:hypothetical protein
MLHLLQRLCKTVSHQAHHPLPLAAALPLALSLGCRFVAAAAAGCRFVDAAHHFQSHYKKHHEEHRYQFPCDSQDLCKLYVHSIDRKIFKSILSWPMRSKSSMLSVHGRPIFPVVPLGIAIRMWVPSSIENPCGAREVRLAAKEVVLASDRHAHLVEFGEHNLNPT